MSAVVPVSEDAAGPVAVLAAVSVAAVLVAVRGSAPAEGHSRTSPAASDGCALGKRLGTVAEAVDMPGVVQVAVLGTVCVAAVLVAVHGSAPSEGYSRMSPAASDGCPLGKRLGTVIEAVDVLGVVQLEV
ncbi:hypothetical protein NDU88_003442 [Pleurodeles waltl]|uniref:Secreted protein n=1 Tax=Pleurodeles waltl TaxID=8319 RepID=A0AAV7WUU5_PLEWA|nr:hypothetical protein NDU88_003442 [Pleurodeles waltl]